MIIPFVTRKLRVRYNRKCLNEIRIFFKDDLSPFLQRLAMYDLGQLLGDYDDDGQILQSRFLDIWSHLEIASLPQCDAIRRLIQRQNWWRVRDSVKGISKVLPHAIGEVEAFFRRRD